MALESPTESNKGTTIVIDKIAPGSSYGEGYIVEIYDFGKKTNEFKAKNKKEVEQIIKQQKDRYNTDRAFETGVQLHVDYKVDEALQKLLKSSSINNGVQNMDIDTILMKKASTISTLLSRLKDPSIPVKVLKVAEDFGSDPMPLQSGDSDEEAALEIKEKLLQYFSDPNSSERIPENDLKGWFADIRTILENKNAQEGANYNIPQIISKLKEQFSGSGLPGEETLLKPIHASIETDKIVTNLTKNKDDLSAVGEIADSPESAVAAEELQGKEDPNEAEVLLTKLYSNESCIYKKIAFYLEDQQKDFLQYIREYKGINTLDNVFAKWSKARAHSFIVCSSLKPFINLEIEKRFAIIKKAGAENSIYARCAKEIVFPYFIYKKIATLWELSPQEIDDYSANMQEHIVDFFANNEELTKLVDSGQPIDEVSLDQIIELTKQNFNTSTVKQELIVEYKQLLSRYLEKVLQSLAEVIIQKDPETSPGAAMKYALDNILLNKNSVQELDYALRQLILLNAQFLSQDHPELAPYYNALAPFLSQQLSEQLDVITEDEVTFKTILDQTVAAVGGNPLATASSYDTTKFGDNGKQQQVVINITPGGNIDLNPGEPVNEAEQPKEILPNIVPEAATRATPEGGPPSNLSEGVLDNISTAPDPSPQAQPKTTTPTPGSVGTKTVLDYLDDPSGASFHQ